MRPLLPLLVVMALALAGLGCPPSDYGTRCRFEGDTTTACGTCIARACQPVVDECCGSYGCKDQLASLDRCSAGNGCDGLFQSTLYGKDLVECIRTACPSECSSSNVVCATRALSCSCEASSTPSSDTSVCSAASVGSASSTGYCCAKKDWPAAGTSCRCFIPSSTTGCRFDEESARACR